MLASQALPQMSSCGTSPPVPPLDDENLLQEILLCLAPQPSSLPRASLVCKRWRSILSDPDFLKRFRKHHGKPPLLGIFKREPYTGYEFLPFLRTKPDRIPTKRFAVPVPMKNKSPKPDWEFNGCRHGLAVLLNVSRREVLVWDPLTGQHQRLPFPPGFHSGERWSFHAAVVCAADAEAGHVHGDCFLSPLNLVLTCGGITHAFACLYKSASGVWGNIVSTTVTDATCSRIWPSILIGSALYWLTYQGDILAFDIEKETICAIDKPPGPSHGRFQLLRTYDSGLGFAVDLNRRLQLWKRRLNCDGVVGWWVLQKTIDIEGLFPRKLRSQDKLAVMVGYDEDSNVIFFTTHIGDYMLELESMRFIRSCQINYYDHNIRYPYRNFYTAGRGVGWKWLNMEL